MQLSPQQLQQLLQLQLQRNQFQQAQQQQNNAQRIQIFASPPNTNHPGSQLAANNALVNDASNAAHGHTASNGGIQFQPLQILQMAQNGTNNTNNNTGSNNNHQSSSRGLLQPQPSTTNHRQNSRPIALSTQQPNVSSLNITQLNQLPVATRMALLNAMNNNRAQQQQQQQTLLNQANNAPNTNQNTASNNNQANQLLLAMRNQHSNASQSNAASNNAVNQQMVQFIQQLQQFPPLFQHLQSNPRVLASLLQNWRFKQEQARRGQQGQLAPRHPAMPQPANLQSFAANINSNAQNTPSVGQLIRDYTHRHQPQQPASTATTATHTQPTLQAATSLLPALENENASPVMHRSNHTLSHHNLSASHSHSGSASHSNESSNDDVIILTNDNDTDIQSLHPSTSHNNSNMHSNHHHNNNNHSHSHPHNNSMNLNASNSVISGHGSIIQTHGEQSHSNLNLTKAIDTSTLPTISINPDNPLQIDRAHHNGQNRADKFASFPNLKRPRSDSTAGNMGGAASNNQELQTKRRKLNADNYKGMITISSDESRDEVDTVINDECNSQSQRDKKGNKERSHKRKKHRRKKKGSVSLSSKCEDSDDTATNRANSNAAYQAQHRHHKVPEENRSDSKYNKQRADTIILSDADGQDHQTQRSSCKADEADVDLAKYGPSFSEIVQDAKQSGNNDEINGDFVHDPLISKIAATMLKIRQNSVDKRMGTPDASGPVAPGLLVLCAALEQMDENQWFAAKSAHTLQNGNNARMQTTRNDEESKINFHDSKQSKLRRKGGELFVTDHGDGNSSNNADKKDGMNVVDKIKAILNLNHNHFFKLNEQASILKQAPNAQIKREFESDLKKLCEQFADHYNEGLLQVFKTCTDPLVKAKFLGTRSKREYFEIWNEIIGQYMLSQIDGYLTNYKIQNAIGLLFGVMDHLFSYSMYQHLCANKPDENPQDVKPEKTGFSNHQKPEQQRVVESEHYITTKGNPLFLEVEHNKAELDFIENNYILWLFQYWRKILLQSQEPLKCLCKSYLFNAPPIPWKQRLYVMITQTPHSPHTTVFPPFGGALQPLQPPHLKQPCIVSPTKSLSQPPMIKPFESHNFNTNKSKSNSPIALMHSNKNNHHELNGNISPMPFSNGHFVRHPVSSMSMSGVMNTSLNNVMNLPSVSVCGKSFLKPMDCVQHQKDCTKCQAVQGVSV